MYLVLIEPLLGAQNAIFCHFTKKFRSSFKTKFVQSFDGYMKYYLNVTGFAKRGLPHIQFYEVARP